MQEYEILSKGESTQNLFFSRYESAFAILSDCRTVVGIEPNGLFLIKENIISKKTKIFANFHSTEICTVCVNEKLDIVLSTANDHRVVQYNLESGQLIYNYGIVNLGYVSACRIFGSIAVLGGWNHKFGLIDLKTRIVYSTGMKTSAYSVFSIQVLAVENQSKKIIILCGGFSDYNSGESDIFEFVSFDVEQSKVHAILQKWE